MPRAAIRHGLALAAYAAALIGALIGAIHEIKHPEE